MTDIEKLKQELEESIASSIDDFDIPFGARKRGNTRQKVVSLYIEKEKSSEQEGNGSSARTSKKTSRATKAQRSNISQLEPKKAVSKGR